MSRKDEMRRVKLGWQIIEWKVAYYTPENVHPSRKADYEITDDEYDAAEVEYLTLCLKLDCRNSVVHKAWPGFETVKGAGMMEVDIERPSVQLVIRKLSSPK